MPIYKVCVVNQSNEGANEVFAIKPYLESFDSFKDEIFIRMPELKNQTLKIYYQGKCAAILNGRFCVVLKISCFSMDFFVYESYLNFTNFGNYYEKFLK